MVVYCKGCATECIKTDEGWQCPIKLKHLRDIEDSIQLILEKIDGTINEQIRYEECQELRRLLKSEHQGVIIKDEEAENNKS